MQCRFTESTNVHTERGKGIRQESQVIYLKDIGPTVQWSDKCFGSQCRETQRHPEINEKSQMQLRHSLFLVFWNSPQCFFLIQFFFRASVTQWWKHCGVCPREQTALRVQWLKSSTFYYSSFSPSSFAFRGSNVTNSGGLLGRGNMWHSTSCSQGSCPQTFLT